MNDAKDIGLDVHQGRSPRTGWGFAGEVLMESIVETKTAAILQVVHGLRGSLHVNLEEEPALRDCTTY